mgnify:CR=1 FL=1
MAYILQHNQEGNKALVAYSEHRKECTVWIS